MTPRFLTPLSAGWPATLLLGTLALATAGPPGLASQTTAPGSRLAGAASPASYRAHLEFLASDLLEGRGTATRGGLLAAQYIATQFQRLGLEPAGDSGYFHRVPIIGLTPDPLLRVTGALPKALAYRDDYVLWSLRDDPEVSLGAPAVFVGYGIVAPEWHWNDYAGVDPRGKIVVCLVNDPGLRDSTLFRGRILTYYGRWTYKIEEAARQGAAGILLVHSPESATYPWGTVTGSWTGEQVRIETPPTSLVAAGWIRDTAVALLFSQAGLDYAALAERAATRAFRAVELPFGFEARVKSAIRRSTTYNVIARLRGRGPRADEAVLIGGHYDHFGIRTPVNGDSIYNGAEDNASGAAAVIVAAEAFVTSGVRPGRSILFVGFGAEESGLLGSQALVERPVIPLRDLAAVLNLDVLNLYGPTRDIAALGFDQSSLGPVFQAAAAAERLRVSVNQDALIRGAFFRSDHFPFARAGVPALSIEPGEDFIGRPAGWGRERRAEYTEQRYHKPQDEVLPWFSMDGAMQQIRVVLRTALAVAQAPAQPVWERASEFRAAGEARRQP
ncbi:MAG TPA: M28 family peptidase [Gemmatimonadales bacterium]|jgi:Zn-dependent M28 family amino/carboxypeptidase|nr:M28 family peptidase [Gemmatimonadales bacterium]